MQKKEFIEKLAEKLESSKSDAEKSLNAVFELITEVMSQGDEFAMTGFGKFASKDKVERKGRNPGTGAEITIAAKTSPVFKAAIQLKNAVNQKGK